MIAAECGHDTKRVSRGLCTACYARARRAGTLDQYAKRHLSFAEHWRLIPKPDKGCWFLPLSAEGSEGYVYASQNGVSRRAHILAYETDVGPVPNGLELDHLCRIRACVRPSHLEPVTHAENARRGLAMIVNGARQRAKTHCPSGHEYTPENTRVRPSGARVCRTCHRLREAARRAAA